MEQYMYLCDAAVLAADDPREGVRESGGVGADQRARLVHVRAQLEELKRNTFIDYHAHLPLSLTWLSGRQDLSWTPRNLGPFLGSLLTCFSV